MVYDNSGDYNERLIW